MKKDYLLEVGCENIPSGYLASALRQLAENFTGGLRSERIPFASLNILGTPKRLVVVIEGLSSKQKSIEERIVGPPCNVAFSPDGQYTKAAEGFARSQGVGAKSLKKVETERGEYIAVVKVVRGKSSASILRVRIPEWLGAVKLPKAMRWDDSGFRFARPIRWIVSLYGSRVLKLDIGSVTAGRKTRVSPYYESALPVDSVRHYFSLMKKNRVILDPEERRGAIRRLAGEKALSVGGRLVEDEELVGSVADLLESPVVLVGEFDSAFLELPREVIVTALKSHQRYFSISGRGGKLRPNFIAFADGARRNTREILKGYERVLQARLADADFYFREDTAKPIHRMAEKLGGIVWLEGLGNVAQKAQRIEKLALSMLAAVGGGDELGDNVRRAALLAKADLASEMVKDGKEFTLLQGSIGREYARVSGESEEVSQAIYEHYLPRYAGDDIPSGDTGLLVALADKLDTIAGGFLMGLEPTGSQDPYALRRHALGILRISIAREARLSLPRSIERSLELFDEEGLVPDDMPELSVRIFAFFTQRFKTMLRGDGFDHDLVASILNAPWEVPIEARGMVEVLQRMRRDGELADFVLAMKRVANIIPASMKTGFSREAGERTLEAFSGKDESKLGFSSAAFAEKSEDDLYAAVSIACAELMSLEGERPRCFSILGELVPVINVYFDKVLVNCEDEALRNNRLSFLRDLYLVFSLYCDFSAIAGE